MFASSADTEQKDANSLSLSRPLQSWLGVCSHFLQLEKHVQRQDLESTSVLLQN